MSEIVVTCECGAPMTERINSINGSRFLGCQKYPECQQTRPIPAAVEMRRAGGVELPGFES